MQEQAIDPILAGAHVMLVAPTAGGKTEAATFPVLSRMLDENWAGLSVIDLCPLRALLNNLLPRLEHYGRLVGRRVAMWHGDVGESERRRILADPPDMLLTTPESLEVMLVSRRVEHEAFLRRVRAVIVDEVHAFAADDRGWHMLSVLERVQRLSESPVQRVGLSATVGNPDDVLTWLAASSAGRRTTVHIAAPAGVPADVKVDYVGGIEQAAVVISRLHHGEKRLVFCDSRARVEELASLLRQREIDTYVSHSSLSPDERRQAEAAFASGNNCVIVATGTLELGTGLALSIRQPFADKVLSGEKPEEYRSQPTQVRGRIHIYASLGGAPRNDDGYPRGVIVGEVTLYDCRDDGECYAWLLKDPMRWDRTKTPAQRANPVWFRPWGEPAGAAVPGDDSTRNAGGVETREGDDAAVGHIRTRTPNDLWETNEPMCIVRQFFSEAGATNRAAAVPSLARAVGYGRTGARIAEQIDKSLRTAVRRILVSEGGSLSLISHSLDGVGRDHLKAQFLSSIGRQWLKRDDAIRGFARWMGFRRTGSAIDETCRSLINGLLRDGRLEADGQRVRRI